jgi:serine/threonine-protein kinase
MGVGDDDTISGSVPAMSAILEAFPELVANRYKVVRWLGSGGMGRVYEALDTELDETVAIKVLRSGLTDNALERFRREVRLTRRIQHPNVARMFDIGDHRGDKFLTMELVDGEALSRLGRPLRWPRLLQIARQLCAGLAAAHDKGVIHRDLKPDNVLIERATERAVITDFGIARSVDDPSVTQVGSVMGTPRYMSPEQLHARAVDARADLFSLGVIMFELATGDRPWSGENAIAIAVAQSTHAARPITGAELPSGFVNLVARCLELEPDRRPPTAHEVGEALEALGTLPDETVTSIGVPTVPARAVQPSSSPPVVPRAAPITRTGPMPTTALAVLPLACAAGDEYLADGVLEDLIDTLSSTAGIRVRPAGVVRSRVDPDARELGRQLDVDHVIIGSLRRTPAGLRVNARLISVADGFQIWAHRIDGTEADILQMSEQLGRGIAAALSTRAVAPTRPTDPRAVDLYLRARAELRLFWASHAQAAAALLDQAFEISPSSVPIAAARAYAATQAWVMSGDPELAPRARAAIEHALAFGHAEAFLASASYKINIGDALGGVADLGTALVRAPMLGQAHEMAGKILVEVDAISEARHHFETARSLDPARTHIISNDLARLDALEGHWDRAERAIATVAADPDRAIAQLGAIFLARLATWRGDREALVTASAGFAPRMNAQGNQVIAFIKGAVRTGQFDLEAWRQFASRFGGTDLPRRNQLMGLQMLSEVAVVLDKTDLAFETLERADQLGLMDVVVLDRCPLFEPFENEPRFRRLRERVRERAAKVLAAFRSTAG